MLSDLDAAILCERSYHEPATLEAADCHVLLVERDGIVNVAFRGSASLLDWWVDFSVFNHTSFDHETLGLVHAGFLADALAIVPALTAAIGDKPWMALGHSKGSGEATLVAALLSAAGKAPVGLTLFGCPKVTGPWNAALGSLLKDIPALSFRNGSDPVPMAPLGFHDAVPLLQLGTSSEFPVIADHYLTSGYIPALTLRAACPSRAADAVVE